MNSPWLYALTVGPLGFYLWTLALWHSYKHPKVVNGLTDFTMLAFGIGGVLAFGPFGQLLARALFRRPDLIDWLVIVSGLGLAASVLARRSLLRLVVYHVDPETLRRVVGDVLREGEGRYEPTLTGFEDRASGRGVAIDSTPRLSSAVIEAYGNGAEPFMQEFRVRLRERFRDVPVGPSLLALALYGLALAVMVAPLVGLFLTQPRAREALRVLIDRLRGV